MISDSRDTRDASGNQSSWYTPAEVAAEMGVCTKTVLAWIDDGALEAVDVSRRPKAGRPTWKISPAALRLFQRARSSRSLTVADEPSPRTKRGRKSSEGSYY